MAATRARVQISPNNKFDTQYWDSAHNINEDLKTEVSLWSLHYAAQSMVKNLKAQQSSVILDFCLRITWAKKTRACGN